MIGHCALIGDGYPKAFLGDGCDLGFGDKLSCLAILVKGFKSILVCVK